MQSPKSNSEKILEEAVDHIDSAIHLLRTFAKLQPSKLEEVEDIIALLEDAGEALDNLSRSLHREGSD